jgi:hypothetical protein
MPTLPDDYYPDPDALYEERNEWHDYWYDDIDRDCDPRDPYEDDEDEEEEDDRR